MRNSLRKTSVDIPPYIAEDCGKANDPEFARSISAANGLASRLEYHALMASDLRMIGGPEHALFEGELTEAKKMLNGFNRRLQ